ncbi:MAG: CopD family protein [Sphingobacteriales bacterium]|nr:MAG: CopD family protein [Sphingobacteriales bacterium]TAF80202.1 MAG: CopD family protein [Sphingobacteriales bacterium]
MLYPYILATHIVFVVSWMAGLFYIVRLFIYHTEANLKPEAERIILQKQFEIMEGKLWNIITTPAMLLTVGAGLWMLYLNPLLLKTDWMWVKLGFVAGLIVYHIICGSIITQLKRGKYWMTSTQLRLWNELATLFLVAIVFTVILKSAIDWAYGLAGLVVFALIIMLAVKAYKKSRLKRS